MNLKKHINNRMNLIKFSVIIFVFSIFYLNKINAQKIDTTFLLHQTKPFFSRWFEQEIKSIKNAPISNINYLNQIFFDRIKIGYFIPDEEIIDLVRINAITEFMTKRDTIKDYKILYTSVISLINKLELVNDNRLLLLIKLHELKFDYYKTRNNSIDIPSELENHRINILETDSLLRYCFVKRNSSNLFFGDYYLQEKKDIKKAEEYFLQIMNYPFYTLKNTNEESMKTIINLKYQYIHAALGILNCRRGNLKQLQNLYFAPAVADEVYPIWKKYITEMGGKWIF